MSDSAKKPEEKKKMSTLARVGIALGIVAVTIFVVWLLLPSQPKPASTTAQAAAQQAPAHTYTETYTIVGDQPLHVEIPFGYKIGASWGYAPLDVRWARHTEWISQEEMLAKGHEEIGSADPWVEWRIHPGFEPARAEVKCTFTKVM